MPSPMFGPVPIPHAVQVQVRVTAVGTRPLTSVVIAGLVRKLVTPASTRKIASRLG